MIRLTSCEFEFMAWADPRAVSEALNIAGIRSMHRDDYTRTPPAAGFDICIEPDTAGRPGALALEAKTRWLEPEDWADGGLIERLLTALGSNGATIDRRAAYHIRVETPEIPVRWDILKNITRLIYRYENVIFGMVHEEARRMGSGVMPRPGNIGECVTAQDYREHVLNTSRSLGLNIRPAADDPPCVELRWHQGTLDFQEAGLWARLMIDLVDLAGRSDFVETPRLPNTGEHTDELISLSSSASDREALKKKHRIDEPGRFWNKTFPAKPDRTAAPVKRRTRNGRNREPRRPPTVEEIQNMKRGRRRSEIMIMRGIGWEGRARVKRRAVICLACSDNCRGVKNKLARCRLEGCGGVDLSVSAFACRAGKWGREDGG